jgi:dipeptidyl aminopeptidase/acylaminoacyl peptidase
MQQHAIEVDHKGQTIRGTVYRLATVKRVPAVLLLHGFTGQRSESGFAFVQIGRALASRGVAAVTFDFLNSGESDGSFDQMLTSGELADALRMTEWLQGQPFADRSRLGLLGFSLGGLLAACTCGRVGVYKALVLMAPTTPQNLVGNVCKRTGNNCPAGEPLVVGPYTMHPKFIEDVLRLDPVADVVRHPRPTLLVQGTGDGAVPPTVSQVFVDAMQKAGVPVRHTLVEGADHVFSSPVWRKQLVEAITGFFVETL